MDDDLVNILAKTPAGVSGSDVLRAVSNHYANQQYMPVYVQRNVEKIVAAINKGSTVKPPLAMNLAPPKQLLTGLPPKPQQ